MAAHVLKLLFVHVAKVTEFLGIAVTESRDVEYNMPFPHPALPALSSLSSKLYSDISHEARCGSNLCEAAGLTAKIRSSIVYTQTIIGSSVQPQVNKLITMQSRPRAVANDKGYVLDDQVGHLSRCAHQRHTSIFQDQIGDSQLTPLQFAALVKLSDLGEVSQNHLGRLTAMVAATMQGVIRRLFARRLLERRPDPIDQRRVLLRLTPNGTTLLATCIANGFTVSEKTLEPLTPSERTSLLDLPRRIS